MWWLSNIFPSTNYCRQFYKVSWLSRWFIVILGKWLGTFEAAAAPTAAAMAILNSVWVSVKTKTEAVISQLWFGCEFVIGRIIQQQEISLVLCDFSSTYSYICIYLQWESGKHIRFELACSMKSSDYVYWSPTFQFPIGFPIRTATNIFCYMKNYAG